jgi:hypothetical protein
MAMATVRTGSTVETAMASRRRNTDFETPLAIKLIAALGMLFMLGTLFGFFGLIFSSIPK